MEEILGLLVALAVIIFKVVGKRLEKSGAPAPEYAEDSGEETPVNPFDVKKWIEEVSKELEVKQEPAAGAAPVMEAPRMKPVVEEAPRAVAKPASKVIAPKAAVPGDDAPRAKEKIDPKKLVVYSEIMNPKFKDEN